MYAVEIPACYIIYFRQNMPCHLNAFRRIEPAIVTTRYKINKTGEFKIIF